MGVLHKLLIAMISTHCFFLRISFVSLFVWPKLVGASGLIQRILNPDIIFEKDGVTHLFATNPKNDILSILTTKLFDHWENLQFDPTKQIHELETLLLNKFKGEDSVIHVNINNFVGVNLRFNRFPVITRKPYPVLQANKFLEESELMSRPMWATGNITVSSAKWLDIKVRRQLED